MKTNSQNGFTLIELLIAMMVFSLLTAFAYRSVSELSSVSRTLTTEEERLRAIQQGVAFIERDLRQSSNLTVANNNNVAAVPAQPDVPRLLLSLDVAAANNKQSIDYLFGKNTLYRKVATGAGGAGNSGGEQDALKLMAELNSAEFSLLAGSGGVNHGIKLVLEHNTFGKIERTIGLPMINVQNLPGFSQLNTLD